MCNLNEGGTYYCNLDQLYYYTVKPIEEQVIAEYGKMYYYFDDTFNKIRYIILDNYDFYYSNNRYNGGTKMSQAQYNWLIDKLQINNYQIIVISHQTCDSTLANYESTLEPLHKILEAFKNKTILNYTGNDVILSSDFTNNNSDLIMHLAGHSHRDESHIDNNVLCITTVCDAYY